MKMDFKNMKTVFHYGKDSQKFIRQFQEKRVDMIIGELRQYSAEEIKAFRQSVIEQVGIIEANRLMAV